MFASPRGPRWRHEEEEEEDVESGPQTESELMDMQTESELVDMPAWQGEDVCSMDLTNMMTWLGPRFVVYSKEEDTGMEGDSAEGDSEMGSKDAGGGGGPSGNGGGFDFGTAPTAEQWQLIKEKPLPIRRIELDGHVAPEPRWSSFGEKFGCYLLYFALDKCLSNILYFIPFVNFAAIFSDVVSGILDLFNRGRDWIYLHYPANEAQVANNENSPPNVVPRLDAEFELDEHQGDAMRRPVRLIMPLIRYMNAVPIQSAPEIRDTRYEDTLNPPQGMRTGARFMLRRDAERNGSLVAYSGSTLHEGNAGGPIWMRVANVPQLGYLGMNEWATGYDNTSPFFPRGGIYGGVTQTYYGALQLGEAGANAPEKQGWKFELGDPVIENVGGDYFRQLLARGWRVRDLNSLVYDVQPGEDIWWGGDWQLAPTDQRTQEQVYESLGLLHAGLSNADSFYSYAKPRGDTFNLTQEVKKLILEAIPDSFCNWSSIPNDPIYQIISTSFDLAVFAFFIARIFRGGMQAIRAFMRDPAPALREGYNQNEGMRRGIQNLADRLERGGGGPPRPPPGGGGGAVVAPPAGGGGPPPPGGGGGGSGTPNGRNGGSGGGARGNAANTGGTGTAGQGNNGGNSSVGSAAGGGGGASAVGAVGGTSGGVGGAGSTVNTAKFGNVGQNVSGTYYVGGGGGGGNPGVGTNNGGAGGNGGGGAGGNNATSDPVAGTANTGGGGGGASYNGARAGAQGGSGIVVISYDTSLITNTVYYLTDTTATNFPVPSDWNSSNNKIECIGGGGGGAGANASVFSGGGGGGAYAKSSTVTDRKSTRLNSSH